MDASSPSRWRVPWLVVGQSLLVGLALGVLAFTSADLFLVAAPGLLAASVGLIVPMVVALAVGLWAGAPLAPESPLRTRWSAASITVAFAGVFATIWSLQSAMMQNALSQVLLLLFLVGAPVYALGFLLPALLAWAEQQEAEEEWDAGERGAAEPSAWQPLGAVVVGVLAGIAVGVLLAGLLLATRLGPGSLLLATAAALVLPTLRSETQAPGQPREQLLYEGESALSTIRVVEILHPGERQPERRLYVNDEEESGELVRSGAPTLAYIAAAEQWLARLAGGGETYLFLGGGAYTLPRRIAERDPQAQITVVELDPEVTWVAESFFQLRREHGILSLHGDARALLEREAGGSGGAGGEYDRIFVDVYDGRESLPHSLVTLEAFSLLRRLLRPGGRVLLNTIGVSRGSGERRFWSIVRTLSEVFPSVALYTHLGRDYPERQNVLLAAAPEPEAVFPERAGIFEPWPREEWPGRAGTLVLRDLLPPAGGAEALPEEQRDERAAHPRR